MAKVLVVEKDSVFSAVLEDRLRVAGHEVRVLADRSQAPRAAREQQADLVILDSGSAPDLGALHEMRAQAETRSLPVVLLSDRAEAADRVAALRAGADDYLARPFDLEELLIRAERLLGGRGAEQMLQGDLATHPLWAVLQYLHQVRKTGSLRVRSGNTSGTVELREGQPVAARWQALRGREAFLALACAEDGSFRFEGGSLDGLGDLRGASSDGEVLPVNELLMHTAWLKDEMEQRRSFLPGTGEPLQTLTDFLPTVGEDFGSLPLQSVLSRIHRQPGIRLFDLVAEETEAPLSTRLALAWLVEHGLVSPRQATSEAALQNTTEISSAMVFDVAVASLLESAKSAGFDTAALPCLVLVEPAAWPALRQARRRRAGIPHQRGAAPAGRAGGPAARRQREFRRPVRQAFAARADADQGGAAADQRHPFRVRRRARLDHRCGRHRGGRKRRAEDERHRRPWVGYARRRNTERAEGSRTTDRG